jgi:hypothetical protein
VQQFENLQNNTEKLRLHLESRSRTHPEQAVHLDRLIERTETVRSDVTTLQAKRAGLANAPEQLEHEAEALLEQIAHLKKQTPKTLFRLRLVEIGLPLVLSCVSILLTLRYPLTEARWREIKEALDRRHAGAAV